MYHTLDPNVFVQPDAPVDLVLVVNAQLLGEDIVANLIDFGGVGINKWVGIDRAEFTFAVSV